MPTASTTSLSAPHQEFLLQLEQRAETTANLQEFLTSLLPELTHNLRAKAGVIWLADPQGNLRPAFQEQWAALGILNDPARSQKHRQLIGTAAGRQQVLVATPENKTPQELPLPAVFVLMPLVRQQQLLGVIELIFLKPQSEQDLSGIVQILEVCAGYVTTFQDQARDPFVPLNAPGFWNTTEPLLLRMYQQLDSKKLAYEAAAAFCQQLGVDRVTIFGLTGRKPKLLAISGQAEVSGHSPLVKQLKSLAAIVARTGDVLMHTGRETVTHPEWADQLSEYLEQAGSQMLAMIPLWSHPEDDQPTPEPNRKHEQPRRMVGVLIIERSRTSKFDPQRQQVLDLLADHLGNALQRAQEHETIFLLPLWRSIGRSVRWLYRHQFWKSVAVLAGVAILTIALIVVPWDYRVTGDGALMPVIQRQVFAPEDAEVDEVFVAGGETVKAGTPLLRLASKELEAEEIRLRTIMQEKQTTVRALRSARENSLKSGNRDEAIDIEGKYAEILVELRHLEQQYQVIEERLKALLITAPIDGVVATFQVRELLQHRPVSRGDQLLEVMDPTGEWHLELKVEDRRMGHLLAARQENPALPVEYILATNPETGFAGTVEKIGTRTQPENEKGNLVAVHVALADDLGQNSSSAAHPPLRIGAEVKAKISCGPKSLGYVLFGDVIDYLRKVLWL